MIHSYVETYPWDLMSPDMDDLLGKLRGEVGVSGLCVWAAARPCVTLRVRNWQPRVFRSRGGMYFQAEKERYEQTRCRPLLSSWTHEGERFARVLAAAIRHGLSLRLAVSASATGRLAEHYPEFAARNALGVESTRNLCLIHPDVQEYLISLVSDLSEQFSPAAIVLSDFAAGWFEAFETHFDDELLSPTARALCGMCFCSSCQQQAEEAGVDALAALEQGISALHAAMESRNGPLEALWAAHPPLTEFRRFQHERLNGLLRSLMEASRCELLLSRNPAQPHTDPAPAVNVGIVSGVITRVGHAEPCQHPMVASAKRNELAFPLALGVGERGPELVAQVQNAASAGIEGLQLSHFGLISDGMIPTMRQAVRFARRTAE